MSFKKSTHELKTSAPLRASDRRKLRARVAERFALEPPDLADELVPEGIQSAKFSTHLDVHGVLYTDADGEPVWFTIGRGAEELIPTVYTLWKRPTLLPRLRTPAAVISVLANGADLMIPGVVRDPVLGSLLSGDLVAVSPFGGSGAPIAVGHMAVRGSEITTGAKGKAVLIVHSFLDELWKLGSKREPPADIPFYGTADEQQPVENYPAASDECPEQGAKDAVPESERIALEAQLPPPAQPTKDGDVLSLSPGEVDTILRRSLLQAIQTQLGQLRADAFPMPSSQFYSSYLLPARPTYPVYDTPVDIKHSSHKNLRAFLKVAEKDCLLRLKEIKGEVYVLAVHPEHLEVQAHKAFKTVGDAEAKQARAAKAEETEKSKVKSLVVVELFKPHGPSLALFREVQKDTSALYNGADLRAIINGYVQTKALQNANEQQYVNMRLDEVLASAVAAKKEEVPEFLKREDIQRRLADNMQPWHSVGKEGREPVVRKGSLKPIAITAKLRQGKRPSTTLTGFEAFLLEPEALADELKKACAAATSVSDLPGKASGQEVLVQGNKIAEVTDLLIAHGVPKKWIASDDLTAKKK